MAGNTTKGEIAYGVIAGVVYLTWIAVVIAMALKSGAKRGETGEKDSQAWSSSRRSPGDSEDAIGK